MTRGYNIEGEQEAGWFRLANSICEMGLSPAEFRLYAEIVRTAGATGQCYKGVRRLAEDCKLDKETIVSARKRLTARGLIKAHASTNGCITVTPITPWRNNPEWQGVLEANESTQPTVRNGGTPKAADCTEWRNGVYGMAEHQCTEWRNERRQHEEDNMKKQKLVSTKRVTAEPSPPVVDLHPDLAYLLKQYGAKRFKNPGQLEQYLALYEEVGHDAFKDAVDWGAGKGLRLADLTSLQTRARNYETRSKPNGNGHKSNGNGSRPNPLIQKARTYQPSIDPEWLADVEAACERNTIYRGSGDGSPN